MSKIIIVALIGLSTLVIGNFYNDYGNPEKEQAIVYSVKNMADIVHFSSKKIDDDFSKEFYKNYLDNLDGLKRFLTLEDINALSKYETLLDDEINNGKLDFFNLSYDLINKGIDKTQRFYEELLSEPFTFDSDETLELNPDNRTWAKDDIELKKQWKQYLKYEVLTRVVSKMEEKKDSVDSGEEKEPKSFEQLEKEAREKIKERYGDMFKRIAKVERNDRFEVYINAFANLFDPHTEYFSPKEKEDFNIRMGGRLEGIGAKLQIDDDYTKIASIIPGGPAWKGKELEPNDLILKAAEGDSDEFVDLVGMRLDKVVTFIRGKKGTKVRLEVKKPDGTIKIIEIIRDEVILEEIKAKSLIVGLDDNENEEVRDSIIEDNIGFIRLPSFYADFFTKGGNSCAKDIKNELAKLNDKNVKGIILDLRYNGGGSLKDVVEMAGFFIESGPIVQVKPGKQKPYVHKDKDSSVEYDGPLIILVNEMSASASEILAAAMQDYNRAIIVGSKETFGKGTVQKFYNLDNVIRGAQNVKPLGNLKVTTQKFYRINGGSTQLKGVTPDIILPNRYKYMEVGERDYDYALEWDKITPLDYTQNVYNVPNIKDIANKSMKRVESDSAFIYIDQNAKKIKEYSDMTLVPLNMDTYKEWKGKRKKDDKSFRKHLNKTIAELEVKNLEVDMPHINTDSSRIARNEDWLKNVRKDQQLKEAIHIMRDMIE